MDVMPPPKPHQPKPHQPKPHQAQPHQAKPHQAHPNQAQPNQQRPNQPSPGAAKPKPEKQLAIPAVAAGDPGSFELLRVWVARQSQQITLRPGVWEDPTAWGVMLADLARSIVKVHEENDEDLDAEAFLAALLEGFDTEIETVLEEFGEEDDEDEPEAVNN